MSTDRVSPEPERGDFTSEAGDAGLAGDPTNERRPGGPTYDDETPAADIEANRGAADLGEGDTQGATGLTGLDEADPGRHQV